MEGYLRNQRSGADQTVRLQLLVAELTKLEILEVTEADVDAEINRMAEESGRKPLAVRAHLEARNQLDQLRQSLSRNKVGDFLKANNTIKLVAPKPAEEPREEPAEKEDEKAAKEPKPKAESDKPKAEAKAAPKAKADEKESKPKAAAKTKPKKSE
jgi:outer membrane biosynthesis protein TonB